MRNFLHSGAIAICLLGSGSLALAAETTSSPSPNQPTATMHNQSSAQNELKLTAAQRQMIMRDLSTAKEEAAPSGFHPSVGITVPGTLALQQLPGNVTAEVPSLKSYEFAKLQNNHVLLVNPHDRKVVEIITK